MYGRILRKLRESKGRGQAEVARSVGISPAHLARLESSQRGLYVEDFVRIVETLGEKPGNLLPNDLGNLEHLKPLIDRLARLPPEALSHVSAILQNLVLLTDDLTVANGGRTTTPAVKPSRKSPPAAGRKARR